MSKLPVVQYPTFSCKQPSTGKTIKFRTYNVREEKLLIIALEAGDIDTIINNVKQVINNCTFNTLDVDKLPSFDIEYLFLQMRSKSVGEKVTLNLYNTACPLKKGEGRCDNPIPVTVDITEVGVSTTVNGEVVPFDHTKFKMENQIMLTPSIGVTIRQPRFEDLRAARKMTEDGTLVVDKKTISESGFDLIARCTVAIFDEDQIYKAEDFTTEELADWYGKLQPETLEKIDSFFSTLPEIQHSCQFSCGACDFKSKYEMRGLRDFFV